MKLPPVFPRTAVAHAGIAKSLRYISMNYYRPIRVSDLEKIGGLSRRGFLKAFRKHTGVSPAQVLRHLRIERAKRLLVESDQPLGQLAAQCGFRSANSFWAAFREVTGVAPKQFQRQTWLENYRLQLGNGTTRKRTQLHIKPEFNSQPQRQITRLALT